MPLWTIADRVPAYLFPNLTVLLNLGDVTCKRRHSHSPWAPCCSLRVWSLQEQLLIILMCAAGPASVTASSSIPKYPELSLGFSPFDAVVPNDICGLNSRMFFCGKQIGIALGL